MKSLGERTRELREQRGWSQAQLAQRSGLSASFISRLERNEYLALSSENSQHLADAFGVTLTTFLADTQPTLDERLAVLFHRYPPLRAAFLNASYKMDDAGVELLINAIEGTVRFYDAQQRQAPTNPPS